MKAVNIIVVTGLSGSGKSTAIRALEDLGFFCIDNLPAALLPKFVELTSQSRDNVSHIALVMDVREESFIDQAAGAFDTVRAAGHDLHVIFLEAEVDILVRRYSETRRVHPLAGAGSVRDGIRRERDDLSSIRQLADQTLDTSHLTVHQLKHKIAELYSPNTAGRTMAVTLLSFGFKRGLPSEADMVFDVRFVGNPYFVDRLRSLTGMHPDVASYVLTQPSAQTFLVHVFELLAFLLPQYEAEGKRYLTVAVGCTGGQHRSVALAEEIGRRIEPLPFMVNLKHRELEARAGVH